MSKRIFITEEQYKRIISEMVDEINGTYYDELETLDRKRSDREKVAEEICRSLGYDRFWYDHYLKCVELQSNEELNKVPYGEIYKRGERIQQVLRSKLGGDCRVDVEIRGVTNNGMSISSYAKLYV